MNSRRYALPALLVAVLSLAPALVAQTGTAAQAPVTKKVPHETKIHGLTLTDDYFWLRDKSNPEVIKHLEDENAYTDAVMEPTEGLQETLYKEMLAPHQADRPERALSAGRLLVLLAHRRGEAVPYPLPEQGEHCRAPRRSCSTCNELAEGHTFLGLGGYSVSDDGNLLAYSTDTTGFREYTLSVKDLRTGKTLPDAIETHRLDRLGGGQQDAVLHRPKTPPSAATSSGDTPRLPKDERPDLRGEGRSLRRGRGAVARPEVISCLVRAVHHRASSRSCRPTADRAVQGDRPPRVPGHDYDADHHDGQFYIRTNKPARRTSGS